MTLSQLTIGAVRNLSHVDLVLSPAFNVFYGQNGSGKTSILEAIYLLSLSRSFRHHAIQSVIGYSEPQLSVFGCLSRENITHRLGIEKTRDGKTKIRLNGENIASVAKLSELLPLQLIHPDSDTLLTGSPVLRRQFMDWGVFHVEHAYLGEWQRWQKSLKQRNAALKAGLSHEAIFSWDGEYVKASEAVSHAREGYIAEFEACFQEIIVDFLPEYTIKLNYVRGWSQKSDLSALLKKNIYHDIQRGHTHYGPHRDDLVILTENNRASEVLSRGEQKLVVIALKLAQGKFLKSRAQKACVYLLDDFAAELDFCHRQRVVERLVNLQSQVFLTTIDYHEVKACVDFVNPTLFHVEHGVIA